MWMSGASLAVVAVAGVWKYYGHDSMDISINKKTYPGYKYPLC